MTESPQPEILTEFLAADHVRAQAIEAITSEGVEPVVMIEFFGRVSGAEGGEASALIVVSKSVAEQIRSNLDATIENWGNW